MPTYKVKGPDGRTVTLQGETPPTDSDLDEIFASLPKSAIPKQKAPAYGGLKGLMRGGVGGPTGYFGVPGSEDILPMVGQTVGTLAGPAGSIAGATAGETARQGLKALHGEDIKLSSIPMSAATTAITEGLFRGAGRLAQPITNKLMIAAIRPAKETLKRIPNFGSEAADQGFWGTLNMMKGQASKYLDELEPKLQGILSSSQKSIPSDDVINQLSEMKRRASNINDETALKAIQNVEDAVLKKGKNIPIGEANQFKRDLYSAVKDSQWGKGQGEIPQLATARKSAAYGLRKGISEAEPSVIPINKSVGIASDVLEGVGKQQQKTLLRQVLPFAETAVGVGGLATGNPWLTAAILARRVASSPFALSTAAQAARFLGKESVGRPLTIGASELARRMSGN